MSELPEDGSTVKEGGLTLGALQRMILQMYGQKDAARGDAATFLWLAEEFGELATALRSGTRDELSKIPGASTEVRGEYRSSHHFLLFCILQNSKPRQFSGSTRDSSRPLQANLSNESD